MNQVIQSIENKVACSGSGNEANTGKLGCLSLLGTLDNLLGVKKGFKIPANTVFDLAFLKPLIMNGTIVPLIGASAFEDVSGEDSYSTNSSGVKRLNLKGLPEYKFMFEEGHEFYRQLDKLEGYKNLDYIVGDEEGNWVVAKNGNGTYGGLIAGHTTPELTKRKVQGGDAESKSVLIQFLERSQFDRDYGILHRDQLNFSPLDIPLINGVNISFDAVAAAADTTLEVACVLAQDNDTAVDGLTEFVVSVNGVDQVPTVASGANANQSILTLGSALSSADVVTVRLGTLALSATDSNDVLYRAANGLTDIIA